MMSVCLLKQHSNLLIRMLIKKGAVNLNHTRLNLNMLVPPTIHPSIYLHLVMLAIVLSKTTTE